MKKIYSNNLVILVLCVLFSCCTKAQKVTPLFPCTEKLDDPYGICCHLMRPAPTWDAEYKNSCFKTIEDLDISFVRNDLDWIYVNTKASKYQDVTLSMYLDTLSHTGIKELGILPQWEAIWDSPAKYRSYCKFFAEEYSGKIDYWEVMNEVDMLKKDVDVSEMYVDFLKYSYEQLKAADSNNKVLYTGVANLYNGFFEKTCKLGAYRYFDIMNFHTYALPEEKIKQMEYIKQQMVKYGWSAPVWITETGTHTAKTSKEKLTKQQLEIQQADNLSRTYIICFAYGIDKVFWYNLRSNELKNDDKESHFGITHSNMSLKPAYHSFKTLTRLCPSGSTRPVLYKYNDGTYLASWTKPDNKNVWAVWNSESEKQMPVNIIGKSVIYDNLGRKLKKKKTYSVGKSIIYITGAKNVTL